MATDNSGKAEQPPKGMVKISVEPDEVTSAEHVQLDNPIYQNQYNYLLLLAFILSAVIAALLGIVYYQETNIPQPKVYQKLTEDITDKKTGQSKTVIRDQAMPTFGYPLIKTSTLKNWAMEAITSSYSLNYVHYRDELNRVKHFYTPTGFRKFYGALNSSGFIKQMVRKQIIITAVPAKKVVIIQSGQTTSGTYAWTLQVPVLLTFETGSDRKQNLHVFEILVVRTSTLDAPMGIAIESIVDRGG